MIGAEFKPSKVTKKGKKLVKTSCVGGLIDIKPSVVNDVASPEIKSNDRKGQGIVIDGKTYTCATCKTGHRVGVCKHGRDRPMKATHPPGRPPAGAPKKVVCDCPKQCTCAKRDCKCARDCNCTQLMYMLVYVPAPGEEELPQQELGEWKLGEQVTTDLKGNILSASEVRERNEQKVAQQKQPAQDYKQGTNASSTANGFSTPKETEEAKSCCKHKDAVESRGHTAEVSPQPGPLPNLTANGCNCGHTCICAFCPQHPNNATSMNVTRQQFRHFRNQTYFNDDTIVPFTPDVPQHSSCMGGQPQFAMSRTSTRPSTYQMQQAFPGRGFVFAYPVLTSNSNTIATSSSAMIDHTGVTNQMMFPAVPLPMAESVHPEQHAMDMIESFPEFEHHHQPGFDVGDALVVDAGGRAQAWDPYDSSTSLWDGNCYMSTSSPFGDGLAQATRQVDLMSPSTALMSHDAATVRPQSSSFNAPGIGQSSEMLSPTTLDDILSTPYIPTLSGHSTLSWPTLTPDTTGPSPCPNETPLRQPSLTSPMVPEVGQYYPPNYI